jgi:NAD(P)-dependent dehydrogenase (short-subunit alcohol dehydrogenase family)
MSNTIAGITMPDSKMALDLTQMIRDTESDLLFHHSTRVYLFGALTGQLGARFGRPEEVTPVVVFLASDDAACLTGERINASGGLH